MEFEKLNNLLLYIILSYFKKYLIQSLRNNK